MPGKEHIGACRPPADREASARAQVVQAHEASNEVSVVQSLAGKPVNRTYKCFDKVRS